MPVDFQHWQDRLAVLADKHGVPGAQFALLADGAVTDVAYGVLNVRTGAPATTDSLFQIGSITKVWTATLILQLVDEGLVDLDAPVVTYLPDFAVADPAVSAAVTIRHLLAHTSGIDGDLFLDTGRGDDALDKYVAACARLGQTHPLGATMSYCNSGYCVLGRVVEVLRGRTWDAEIRDRLLTPLGLDSAGTLPEEALLHGAACGHLTPPGGSLTPAPMWGIFRSTGPAGLIHATSRQVLAFAQLHLAGGLAPDGSRLLSEASVAAMQTPQVELLDQYTLGSHWGLGWFLMTWSGSRVFGHDGATIGQGGFLRVVPEAGVALCLLTNGGAARDLYEDLFREALRELSAVELPARLEPPPAPVAVDTSTYVGSYRREGVRIDVAATETGLTATVHNLSGLSEVLAGDDEGSRLELVALEQPGLFVARAAPEDSWNPAVFGELDGTTYLHFGARATPKVS